MRVLVVGTGSAGMRHLRTLARIAGVVPVAVPARGGRSEAPELSGFEAHGDLDRALATSPRAAIIATDSGRHAADAERCLEASCDVLVEKPLAVRADAANALVARARRVGRGLHVACCLRFDPGLVWMKEHLPEIGEPTLADAECISWLPAWRPGRDHGAGYAARQGEGGVLLDLVHEFDYCSWLLGPIRRVMARLENKGVLGLAATVEETALLLLEHDSGIALTMRLSYAVQPASRRLRIWGREGLIEWNGVVRTARRFDTAGEVIASTSWDDAAQMYVEQAEAWVGYLRRGEPGRLVDGDEAAMAVAVCDAAKQSASTQRWALLP